MKIESCLIQIFVSNYEKAISWYQNKLGMNIVNRYDEWKSAIMRLAEVDYDICQPIPKWGSNWIKAKKNIGGLKGIFFYTQDIEKAYQELKSKEVKFIKPPFKTPWGEHKAHFVDLDGNEFSLVQK